MIPVVTILKPNHKRNAITTIRISETTKSRRKPSRQPNGPASAPASANSPPVSIVPRVSTHDSLKLKGFHAIEYVSFFSNRMP